MSAPMLKSFFISLALLGSGLAAACEEESEVEDAAEEVADEVEDAAN
jgi:hypothetical protein